MGATDIGYTGIIHSRKNVYLRRLLQRCKTECYSFLRRYIKHIIIIIIFTTTSVFSPEDSFSSTFLYSLCDFKTWVSMCNSISIALFIISEFASLFPPPPFCQLLMYKKIICLRVCYRLSRVLTAGGDCVETRRWVSEEILPKTTAF